jgi:hypothetical protein
MAREVSVRIVGMDVGERASLEDYERIGRVEWNGRRGVWLVIVQDPAPPALRLSSPQDTASHAGGQRRLRERMAHAVPGAP